MAIDTALLGILISLLVSVIIGSVWIGKMSEKVQNNRTDIEAHRIEQKEYQSENKEEHKTIIARLDKLISNGGGKA